MNLQGRVKRWAHLADTSLQTVNALIEQEKTDRLHGAGLPNQAMEVLSSFLSDPILLTVEADTLTPGTWLADTVAGVVEAVKAVRPSPDFRRQLVQVKLQLEAALPLLNARSRDDDASIDDILDELERAMIIALIVNLTSHKVVLDKVEEWKQHHTRFTQGNVPHDYGHYLEIKTMQYKTSPGPGRVHMRHLDAALDSGASIFAAGATSTHESDHYPELQSIAYAQWFTYVHAIWDEQFRRRIADLFNRSLDEDEQLDKGDVLNDYFGDIRLVRNDFVHKKGIVVDSSKIKVFGWGLKKGEPIEITPEQMLEAIDRFPRAELSIPPTRQKRTRKNLPGSVDQNILERFLKRVEDAGLDRNEIYDQLLEEWTAGK